MPSLLLHLCNAAFILFVILSSFSSISSSDNDNCQWRFDDCSRQFDDSRCVLRLRSWCSCEKNTSCATNYTIEVNTTTVRSLIDTVDSLCNLASCVMMPRKCEWTPWSMYMDICYLQRFERFAGPCCHPVYRTEPLNVSLNTTQNLLCSAEPQREVRTRIRTMNDCRPTRKKTPIVRVNDDQKVEKGWKRYELYLCGLLLFLLILIGGAAVGWKKQRQGFSGRSGHGNRDLPIIIDLRGEETRPLPKHAIVPQPGQPLSEAQTLR